MTFQSVRMIRSSEKIQSSFFRIKNNCSFAVNVKKLEKRLNERGGLDRKGMALGKRPEKQATLFIVRTEIVRTPVRAFKALPENIFAVHDQAFRTFVLKLFGESIS